MRDRPAGVTERDLVHALADGWGLAAGTLRWALDDISCFVRDLRAPHRRTPGAEHAWQSLELSVAQLTG